MSDAGLVATLLAAFLLAVGLVRLLGRLIGSGAPDGWACKPPDTNGASATAPAPHLIDVVVRPD